MQNIVFNTSFTNDETNEKELYEVSVDYEIVRDPYSTGDSPTSIELGDIVVNDTPGLYESMGGWEQDQIQQRAYDKIRD